MKAMRLHAINDFRLEEVEKPQPRGKEILIKVGACGICGSDIPRVYELGTKVYPVTLGHEYAGTVVAVGEDADPDLIGKVGAVYPVVPCGQCDSCQIGQYAQCSDYHNLGSRTDGGFAEYCLLPSDWHLVVSNNPKTTMEELSIVEPATVALHAIRKGEVKGMLLGTNVMLVDFVVENAEFARERGFTVINAMKQDCVEEVSKLTKGKMADVVIEGTGTSAALNQAIECSKPFAMVTLLGNPHRDTTIKLDQHSMILRKELRFTGVWNNYYSDLPFNEWKYTVDMLNEGKLEVLDLITHRSDLDHLKQLFDDIHDHKVTICKAIYTDRE